MPRRTNVEPLLRWSLRRASREFLISAGNLASKLGAAKEHPGPDSCFSTSQITTAIFGDLWKQRHAKLAAETAKIELETGILRGKYVDRFALEQLHALIAEHIKSVIRGSGLTREDQDGILKSISSLKFRVASIVADQRQSGQNGEQGSGNGDGSEEPPRRKRGEGRGKLPKLSASIRKYDDVF